MVHEVKDPGKAAMISQQTWQQFRITYQSVKILKEINFDKVQKSHESHLLFQENESN